MVGNRKFSKISKVLLAAMFVVGVSSESYSRGSTTTSSSKRTGSSRATNASSSKRAGSSSVSSSKRAGSSSTTKRSGSKTSSRTSSRSGSARTTSSRSGSRTVSSASMRAASFFNSASSFNTVSAMVQANDPQTQAEAECMTDYTSCMDMLIPYVISQNPFLRDSAEVKYMQDADHDLRFVYDATSVSEDGTECDGKNCAEDSRASVLFRNYNYFCSEGGMSTARDCRNIGGTWNAGGYKCYDVDGSGYTGNYDGGDTSSTPYAKPDGKSSEFKNWSKEEGLCKEYGGVWSQCMPKDNDVTSTSLKDLRRCYYDKESYLTQKGSRSSTAYYQELSDRLSLPAGDPNSLKVVDLGRTIISALGFKTDDMPKIGNSNYSFAVSVTPPATMLNAAVSLAQMDDICFIARDGNDDKVDQRIRMKSKKLASESYYGELVDHIKELASQEYVDENDKTHNNACKEIRGRLKKFYLTGISSVLIKDADTCGAFLGDWSYCYNGDREKGSKEYYSTNGGKNGEEICTSRNASWSTEKSGYCVWDQNDESVCELFGAEPKLDDEGNFSCTTNMSISNAGDCEGFGYYWNGKSGKCFTSDKYTTPIQTHRVTLGTDKNKRIEVFQVFDTPRKSSAKYEQALQAERLSWRSKASDYIMANAGKIENDIKRQEMADLLADAEIANELATSQQELLEKCNGSLNTCIYKDSICGKDGVNCITADGFKSSKLSMVGLSCYPTYKKCVQNIMSTINKGASPFLTDYLQSFNSDTYWGLAKETLASSLSEIYVDELKETCKTSGGTYSEEECYLPVADISGNGVLAEQTVLEKILSKVHGVDDVSSPVPDDIASTSDGKISYGEPYRCEYNVSFKDKELSSYIVGAKCTTDGGRGHGCKTKGDSLKRTVTENANNFLLGVNSLDDTKSKDGCLFLGPKDDDALLSDAPATTAWKSGSLFKRGFCRAHYEKYKSIDVINEVKKIKIVKPTFSNNVSCTGSSSFAPKGWKDFTADAKENASAIIINGIQSLNCKSLGGTYTPKYANEEGKSCSKGTDGCSEDPIVDCKISDQTPFNYMLGEIMEAMSSFDNTIDSNNANRY